MRLAGQLLNVSTAGHILDTLALRYGDEIDYLILSEHISHRHGFLQVFLDPVGLVFDGSKVQLDLDDVGVHLSPLDQKYLFEEMGKIIN